MWEILEVDSMRLSDRKNMEISDMEYLERFPKWLGGWWYSSEMRNIAAKKFGEKGNAFNFGHVKLELPVGHPGNNGGDSSKEWIESCDCSAPA